MVDFIERRISEIEERKKQVEKEISALNRQVDEVDAKIRAYLADRQRAPHPRHLELIEKVRGYRIDPAATDKHLENLLDNLQWKVYYNAKAWAQLWDNAGKAFQPGMSAPGAPSPAGVEDGEALFQAKSQYPIESLWRIQQEKWHIYGHTGAGETKSDFKKRMIEEYKSLNEKRQAGQEIVMTYDVDAKRCRLDLKQTRET